MDYISFDCKRAEDHLAILRQESRMLDEIMDFLQHMLHSEQEGINEEVLLNDISSILLLMDVNHDKRRLLEDAIEDFYTASRQTIDTFIDLDCELRSKWDGTM